MADSEAAAADPSLLTPASFVRTQSDVFHMSAASRVHSMEFPRVDEEEDEAESAAAEQQEAEWGNGGSQSPAVGPSRLSTLSYAAVAGSGAQGSSSDAAAPDAAGGFAVAAAGDPVSAAEGGAAPEVAESPDMNASPASLPSDSQNQAARSAASSPGQPSAGTAKQSATAGAADAAGLDSGNAAGRAQADAAPASLHAAAGTPSSVEPPTNAEGDLLHPWSLARPSPLAVPNPADAAPATISLANASAPVGGYHLCMPRILHLRTLERDSIQIEGCQASFVEQ